MPKHPSGRCSHCGKRCALYLADETILDHVERDRFGQFVQAVCPGSRKPPHQRVSPDVPAAHAD